MCKQRHRNKHSVQWKINNSYSLDLNILMYAGWHNESSSSLITNSLGEMGKNWMNTIL